MSSAPSSPPRRRCGWRIAGITGVVVAGAAALMLGGYLLAEPVIGTVSMVLARPHMQGCTTSATSDATVGPLWYRLTQQTCDDGAFSMHYVFVAPARWPTWFMPTAVFLSAGGPVPTGMRQTGNGTFEIELAEPLDDGRDRLPVTIDRSGFPTEMHVFAHGQSSTL